MCGCPKKEKITYYKKEDNQETECTLGKFLFQISHLYTAQCEHCKEPMFRHFIQYYHKEGVVEIQLQTVDIRNIIINANRKYDDHLNPRRGEDRSKQIFMRGEC
jgi:hypothetical protein